MIMFLILKPVVDECQTLIMKVMLFTQYLQVNVNSALINY